MQNSQSTIPEGYKQTEVGIIPEDWNVIGLNKIGEVRGRVGWKGYTKSDLRASGPYTIGAKDINENYKLDLSNATHLSIEKYNESPEIMVQLKDILVVQRGNTIGKLVLIDSDIGKATINPSMVIFRTRSVSADYIFYVLTSPVGQDQIQLDTSSTGVPMISQKQIGNFKVPLPPLPEQQGIAGVLSGADALITSLDRLIAKKHNIKQGVMQLLLTGKKRLAGFSGDWETKKLGDLIEEVADGGTPSTTNSSYFGGKINWIVIEDIKDEIYCTRQTLTELGLARCSSRLWKPGTIIISTGATIGEVGIAKVATATKQGICGITVKPNTNNLFLKYWFRQNKQLLISMAQGSSIKEIRPPTLVELEINIPSLSEQKAITRILSDMDAEIETLEVKREKYKAIKQGMMQELLTGKTRLI